MKPTFRPETSTEYSEVTTMNGSAVEDTHPWLFTKGCPEGSIPITRMPYMNGLFGNNASASDSHIHYPRYLHEHGGTKGEKVDDPTWHEYSLVKFTADKLYGASAVFNLYLPKLEVPHEFSLGQIWVVSNDETTSLEAGWMNNRYETFCYNLQCPGFVWTNHAIRLDTVLLPLSVYGGLQYDVTIEIFQDRNSGDWWVRLLGQLLGYWPKSLVPKLEDGAQIHSFGGEILNKKVSGQHTSTQMGSGHFSVEGYKKAAYIRNIEIVEAHDRTKYTSPDHGHTVITHPNCYDLQLGRELDLHWGFFFFFGGPGRSATCT
ncbi:hypothetical protein Taro_032731 [Colocasia esculenta]|uniref:Neprosin PEP catalytic domain-containing protein n=1 Tax=Colocasia esculenta TaxID=4460 RepID=A0A843W6Z4_COLES|nr:hypothetical protein [Colocasia esculenta]